MNIGLICPTRSPKTGKIINVRCPETIDDYFHYMDEGLNPLSIYLLMFGRTLIRADGSLQLVVPVSTKRVVKSLMDAYGLDAIRPIVDDLVSEIFAGLQPVNPIGLLVYRLRSSLADPDGL